MQPSPANSSPPDPISVPKPAMPRILGRFGYRAVLVSNTLLMGVQILFFAHIGKGTPAWLFVSEVLFFGFFKSLQYSSRNTLVYADVSDEQASSAISIASTVQQMAISFGVASASRRVLAQFWHRWDRIHCLFAPALAVNILGHVDICVTQNVPHNLRPCAVAQLMAGVRGA